MRLLDRGTGPKTDARGPRQLPWSQVIYEDCGAAARQSQTVGASANPSASRSVVFPAPSAAFDRHRSGALEDMAGGAPPGASTRSRPPDRCHSPSKRPHVCRAPRGATDRNRSSERRDRDPASPGVRNFRPSTDVSSARPLPDRAPVRTRHRRLRRALGPTAPPVLPPVPTTWFRTTSPAFSARRTAGLLHPAAGPGVRRVFRNPLPWSQRQRHEGADRVPGETGSFPATLRPFEEFPPPAAVRCHHRLSASVPLKRLRVVTPPAPRCRSAEVARSEGAARLRGVAPRTGPLRPTPFRAPESLVPSMGLCPLRGPDSSAASWDLPRATRPAPKDRPSGRP
jgi:hypothetical protein